MTTRDSFIAQMFVNDDLTIRSPVKHSVTDFNDIWTNIKKGLISKPRDTILLIDQSTGATVTIEEFLSKVEYAAANLMKHGLNRDLPVTIVMVNCCEYLVIACAVWCLGGVVSTVNALSSPSDIKKYLDLLESEFIFCDDFTAPGVVSGAKGTTAKKIFVNGNHPGCLRVASLFVPAPLQPRILRNIDTNSTALIQFSSGTTGFPKAVELSYYSVVKWLSIFNLPELQLNEGKCILIFQPLSHIYGMVMALLVLETQRQGVVMARFDMDEYLKCVVKYKITALFMVPPLAVLFAKGHYAERFDLSHVTDIFCGAAPLSDEVIDEIQQQMGINVEIRQLYGMTEGPGTYSPPKKYIQNVPKNSIGLPFPGVKIKIIDTETGIAVGPMKHGEICTLSDYRMDGYLKNKEATENMIDKDGWLHTGDIGYYDKVGHLFIVDRLKELIKYKGLQVPPAELENVLLSHPDIADTGVTGLPDELAGELPFAYVVLKPGRTVTAEDVHAFVNERVAKYKQLRGGIKFVSQIPKSPSGKILRRIIKMEQSGKATAKL